jgi:hypothetical protein
MDRGKWRSIGLPILVCLALALTNPDQRELLQQMRQTSKNYLFSLSEYFGTSVRNFLTSEEGINLRLLSLVRSGGNSFNVGVAGFWIRPAFWSSTPGMFYLLNALWTLFVEPHVLKYQWFEFLCSSLMFLFFMQMSESNMRVDKFITTFFLTTLLLCYLIASVLYQTGVFKKREHVGSLLYSAASANAIYLAVRKASFRWLLMELSSGQVALAIIIGQLCLGHSYGFAGSLAGAVLLALADADMLNEKYWYW